MSSDFLQTPPRPPKATAAFSTTSPSHHPSSSGKKSSGNFSGLGNKSTRNQPEKLKKKSLVVDILRNSLTTDKKVLARPFQKTLSRRPVVRRSSHVLNSSLGCTEKKENAHSKRIRASASTSQLEALHSKVRIITIESFLENCQYTLTLPRVYIFNFFPRQYAGLPPKSTRPFRFFFRFFLICF